MTMRTLVPVLDIAARLGARFGLVAGNDPDEARCTDNLAARERAARANGATIAWLHRHGVG